MEHDFESPLMMRWLVFPILWCCAEFVTCSGQHSGSDAIFWCVLPFIPWEQNHCHVNKQKLVCRVMRDKLPGSPHYLADCSLINRPLSEAILDQSIPSWPVTEFWNMTAAVAAAKSLQSCPTLCDPIDDSPPGSSVPGILQARTLEWVAISFSNAWMHAKSLQSCPTLWDPVDNSPPGSSVHGIL